MDMIIGAGVAGALGLLVLFRRRRRESPCRHHRRWRKEAEAMKRASKKAINVQADQTERWVRSGGPLPEDVELWMKHSYGSWQRPTPPS